MQTNKLISYLLVLLLANLTHVKVVAQDILYSEDFSNTLLDNKGQNGTIFDMTGVTNWSVDVSNGVTFSAGDYFKQIGGMFQSFNTDATGINSACVWYSTVVDITCYSNVTLSIDLSRNSSNSTSGCAAYYSVDGGADVQFASLIGSNALTGGSVSGLSGSTVQIKVRHWGTSSTPTYRHDNVLVTGVPDYPSIQASALTLSNYTGTAIDLAWTNGNGDRVLVVAKENSTILVDPAKGTSYTANSVYGLGNITGAGNFVVYDGTGSATTITGLTPGTDYDFMIYAFNSAGHCYNPSELFGSTLCTPPTLTPSSASTSAITANSMNVAWANGNGDRTIVVARLSSTVAVDPSSGSSYLANAVFGNGDLVGAGNYVVYDGVGTNVTVSGLISGTAYSFAVYTYNSIDDCYNLTEATCSGTTTVLSSPYEMDAIDGMIIGTCSGTFTDAGGGANYSNNEDYTATFCSASGLPLKFDFSSAGSFDIDVPGDTLFFYDGMAATGTPIAILTYLDDNTQTTYSSQLQINTFSTCVTVRWKSNSAGTDAGWSAVISCGNPPVCASNPPAADIFGQATPVCNIQNYCGTTSGYYAEDTPYNLIGGGVCPVPDDGIFGATIENNSWLKFEALATTATFDFTVSGGSCMSGIQVGVLAFNTTTSLFSLKSPCALTDGGQMGSFTLTATGLTIGETYYLLIDGYAGDNCDYTIAVNNGVAVVNAGPDQAVCATSATLAATSTINTGTWTVVSGTGTFANANNPTTTVSGLTTGSNIFRWTTTTDLCGDVYDDVEIVSSSCLPITLIGLDAEYLAPGIVAVQWTTASEVNNDYFSVERSIEGNSYSTVNTTAGNGTSNQVHQYQIYDFVPETREYYYRIRQTDYDGTISVSQWIVAEPPAANGYGTLTVYSGSDNGSVTIGFASQTDQSFTLSITDVAGRLIYAEMVEATEGQNYWEIPENAFPSGISFVVLQNEKQLFRERVFK